MTNFTLTIIITIRTVNIEKQGHSNGTEIQSYSNWNITHANTEQILTQEEKTNVESIKRLMSEKKTSWPSFRNQDWKKSRQKWKK